MSSSTSSSSVVFDRSTSTPLKPVYESESTKAQRDTEKECQPYFVPLETLPSDQIEHLQQTGLLKSSSSSEEGRNGSTLDIQLLRQKHLNYLSQIWKRPLKAPFVSLDSSRPWMMYWCLHGCDLLGGLSSNSKSGGGAIITEHEKCNMVLTLQQCWSDYSITNPTVTKEEDPLYYKISDSDTASNLIAGGFGGGPNQLPHAATTYAAVLTLCIIATGNLDDDDAEEEAEDTTESMDLAIDCLSQIRLPLYRWLTSLISTSSGGYRMHHDGEIDVRASYTILAVAKLLQIDTPYLTQPKVADFIVNCQTFEGGIGGEPWNEAHGGYAFCGVAALKLLNKLDELDADALAGWLSRRQMSYEGGFSGRSNKLVDGCYSFWQGSAMAITSSMYNNFNGPNSDDPWITTMNNNNSNNKSDEGSTEETSLPFPLLFDAPMLERYILLCAQDIHGGLRDKPSKSRDFYHSCYNLSGLSVAQHCSATKSSDGNSDGQKKKDMYGDPIQSLVYQTHPCYNIRIERVQTILAKTWV